MILLLSPLELFLFLQGVVASLHCIVLHHGLLLLLNLGLVILLVIVTVGLYGLRIRLERLLHGLLHLSGTLHRLLHELLVVPLKGLDGL